MSTLPEIEAAVQALPPADQEALLRFLETHLRARANGVQEPRKSLRGIAKAMFEQTFSPHADPTAALMHGEPFDERDALHIKPLDAVPSDFVRKPGSGAGEIKIADDFDETPEEFKEYM